MKAVLRPAMVLFFALTLICALLYPLVITVIGRLVFSYQVGGSILMHKGQAVGSLLIGQSFTSPRYFWGRPSATTPMPNNGEASKGSNLGPTNPAKMDSIKKRVQALKAVDPTNTAPIPIDLVTASASGLDPEISLAAAYYQLARVARERHITIEQVQKLIDKYSQSSDFDFLGEPRINVLTLNLALDEP